MSFTLRIVFHVLLTKQFVIMLFLNPSVFSLNYFNHLLTFKIALFHHLDVNLLSNLLYSVFLQFSLTNVENFNNFNKFHGERYLDQIIWSINMLSKRYVMKCILALLTNWLKYGFNYRINTIVSLITVKLANKMSVFCLIFFNLFLYFIIMWSILKGSNLYTF